MRLSANADYLPQCWPHYTKPGCCECVLPDRSAGWKQIQLRGPL
jgi:hypothetical protein